jgi:hypothetical protein
MQQLYNGKVFPLLDRLRLALPISSMYSSQYSAYSGAKVGIDTGKLAYFALSILWKASVHQWKMPDRLTTSIGLGVYEESIRKFLLGETAFPLDVVVIVTVCTDSISQESFFVPCPVPENPFTAYAFLARGISFRVLIGRNLPSGIRELCCVTGSKTLIFAASCANKSIHSFAHLMTNNKPSCNLRI